VTVELLKEYVSLLAERENDLRFMRIANNSYIDVSKLLYSLRGAGVRELEMVVHKLNGKYGTIDLEAMLPRPEHEGLYLSIVDHATTGTKGTILSNASNQIGDDGQRTYTINVFYDIPHKSNKEYNVAWCEGVATWFSGSENRANYVHEFVHVMDYRRLSDEYLQGRAATKKANQEAGKKKDFHKYMNDPLETNAYTNQSLATVKSMLRNARTRKAWEAIMGHSPAEFVQKFLTQYLDHRAQKHWDDENQRRAIKRAAQFYDAMLQSAPEVEQPDA